MRKPIVAVIGAGHADAKTEAHAREIGRLLALAGVNLINGGLRGVMSASAAGFQEAASQMPLGTAGIVIGVVPGDSPTDANPNTDVAIVTHMGEARNCIIVNSADVCIAVGGEFGTLSEIALALRRNSRVISLNFWVIHEDIEVASSPEEAVSKALA